MTVHYTVYLEKNGANHHTQSINGRAIEVDAGEIVTINHFDPNYITMEKKDKSGDADTLQGNENNLVQGAIIPEYSVPTLHKLYDEYDLTHVPSVLVFANGNRPGGMREGLIGQEERFFEGTNIGDCLPHTYKDYEIKGSGDIKNIGGIFATLCTTNDGKIFWAIINAAPLLASSSIMFNDGTLTPSDAIIFGKEPNVQKFNAERTMTYILGEVLMQLLMVKNLNSKVFITGAFGCGQFENDPEYYASALAFALSIMQEKDFYFKDIKVQYALGQDRPTINDAKRSMHQVFAEPRLKELAAEAFKKTYQGVWDQHQNNSKKLLKAIAEATMKYYVYLQHNFNQSSVRRTIVPGMLYIHRKNPEEIKNPAPAPEACRCTVS